MVNAADATCAIDDWSARAESNDVAGTRTANAQAQGRLTITSSGLTLCLRRKSSDHQAAVSASKPSRAAALIAKSPNAPGALIGGAYSSPRRSIFVKTTQCGLAARPGEYSAISRLSWSYSACQSSA